MIIFKKIKLLASHAEVPVKTFSIDESITTVIKKLGWF